MLSITHAGTASPVHVDFLTYLDRRLAGPPSGVAVPNADMVQASVTAKCTNVGSNWNYCDDGTTTYSCKSCHEANYKYTCPAASNYGCTTNSDCWKSFQAKAWPTADLGKNTTHDPGNTTPITFGAVADYFTNAIAACQPINCWIFSSQPNPHWGQPWNQFYQYEWTGDPPTYSNPFITMDKTTGVFTFNRDRVFYLRIEFRCDNGFQQFDYTFTLEVACTSTSTALALPAGFTHLPKYAISLTDVLEPNYEFTDFTSSENKCPIMERKLYGDSAYSATVANGLLDLVQRRDSGVQNQYTYFV